MASASAAEGFRYIELRPVTEGGGWDPAALTAAISPTTLPPGDDEDKEKAALRQRGWARPCGLFGYTKDSPYKDLCVYYNAADKTSPVNVAASKAFRCYGMNGRQDAVDWDVIRGPCVIVRLGPPKMTSFATGRLEQMDFPYKPLITPQELVESLLFFRDRDARKVALMRDAARSMMDVPKDHQFWSNGAGYYVSPTGMRPAAKVGGKDARCCATCGKANSIACSLKKCSVCKAVWYCDRECQRKDFGRHKKECAKLAKQQQEKQQQQQQQEA